VRICATSLARHRLLHRGRPDPAHGRSEKDLLVGPWTLPAGRTDNAGVGAVDHRNSLERDLYGLAPPISPVQAAAGVGHGRDLDAPGLLYGCEQRLAQAQPQDLAQAQEYVERSQAASTRSLERRDGR
jgi:hypothetical protein